MNVAQDFSAATDNDTVTDGGMALGSALRAGAAESDALVDGHVVADDCRFADHDAHAVIDEQTFADLRAGMDFDAGQPARDLRKQSRQQEQAMTPEPVIE